MSILNDSSILVTGGTGSFGKALISRLLSSNKVSRIVVYSRDELKQHELRNLWNFDQRLRWFIGDVRDVSRLKRAMQGIDYVVHAAALKQVDAGEYNPIEFIKTNIYGSQNVIEASIDAGVKKVIALSTDKASSPINLYGATKLTADKLFIAANNFSQRTGTRLSVVRYGNVMGSRGSVIPLFKKLAEEKKDIPITDKSMTRFVISLDEAVAFVIESFEMMSGGELYVPRIPSVRITDLALAIAPYAKQYETGIRPGEKLHEEMISEDDSRRTLVFGNRFVVSPVSGEWGYLPPVGGVEVQQGFSYKSNTNSDFLSTAQILDYLAKLQ